MSFVAGTGEHGVGSTKKGYLIDELGENTVNLMKTIKAALDPLNLMNPGKVSAFLFVLYDKCLCPLSFIQIDEFNKSIRRSSRTLFHQQQRRSLQGSLGNDVA